MKRPASTRCGAPSWAASTGSTRRRSTATARRRKRSGGTWSRSCRGRKISTKVRLEAEDMESIPSGDPAQPGGEPDAVADRRRSSCSSCTIISARRLGGRAAVTVEQVLGRGGVADTFDRLKSHGLIHATGITVAGDTSACLEVINSGRFDAAQVYYNVINPSAAWTRVPHAWKGQDFCGVISACFRQNMGVLNIRVWAGGALASSRRPDGLFMMTTDTDLDNEMRCAAAIRQVLGDSLWHAGADRAALRARQSRHHRAGDRNFRDRPARTGARRQRRAVRSRPPRSPSSTTCGPTNSG